MAGRMQGWEVAAKRHGVPAGGWYCPLKAAGEMRADCREVYGGNDRVHVIAGEFGSEIARSNVSRGHGGERLDARGYRTNEVGCEGGVVPGCDG